MEVVKYKDSGVAWIGHIPEHWRVSVIKRTTYIKGRIGWQGLTSEEYQSEGKYLLVTGTDFENGKVRWEGCWYVDEERYAEDPYIQLVNNDVLITKDGTIGKIALVENMPTEATLNSGVFVTRPYKNEYSPQFMFWLLNSDLFPEFIEYSKVGTTISHLYQKTFERFSYPLPPLDEQRRIAAYLDKTCAAIDTAIEKKQKQLETLDALRKSIIHKAVTRGLDDSVELKDSGVDYLGRIPKHWTVDRLKDVANLRNTKTDVNSEAEDYLELEDIEQGTGKIISKRNTLEVESAVTLFKKGDVLFGKLRPYLEKYYFAEFDGKCTGEILAFEPIETQGRFLLYCFASSWFIGQCNMLAYGAKMPRVNWPTQLAKINMPLPPKEEQHYIADHLDVKCTEIDSLRKNITDQISTLENYRKSLIHECVTGKRRIAEEGFAGHTSKLVLT